MEFRKLPTFILAKIYSISGDLIFRAFFSFESTNCLLGLAYWKLTYDFVIDKLVASPFSVTYKANDSTDVFNWLGFFYRRIIDQRWILPDHVVTPSNIPGRMNDVCRQIDNSFPIECMCLA